ncbi:MAG: rhodanese-like domain-containing protein [Candidatus Poseidoniaceae archaeon]
MNKIFPLLMVLTISLAGCTIDSQWDRVSVDEFANAIENNPDGFLLDVRTTSEWSSDGYIEGAKLIPHSDIESRQDELPSDKDDLIMLYCRSGNRSQDAAQTLIDLGYSNIIELEVGITGWKENGNEVVYP